MTHRRNTRSLPAVATLCVTLCLTACGGGSGAGVSSVATAPSSTATSTSGSGSSTGGGTTTPTPSPAPVNHAPTITGTAMASLDAAVAYDFLPVAADADGDKLAFSIAGKPAWANFDTTTGRLSGTPGTTGVGSFANIVISVSDGTNSVSLPAFQILVTGSATLGWSPPTQNMDGSAITGLVGYRIYYGTTPTTLASIAEVANPSLVSFKVTGLTSGTWYFAVSAYNSAGIEGLLSNVGSKTL